MRRRTFMQCLVWLCFTGCVIVIVDSTRIWTTNDNQPWQADNGEPWTT